MFKTILVPTDGSVLSLRAAEAAVDVAAACGAALVAVAVAEPLPGVPGADSLLVDQPVIDAPALLAMAQQRADVVASLARAAGVACRTSTALSYYPYEEILQAAADFHCDAIFMASHGRSGLKKLFLGSQAEKVLAHSHLPVLVFR